MSWLAWLLLAPACAAQEVPTFRAETRLALVRFQVSPKKGQFLSDLRPDEIEIREDGVPQKIALFEGGRLHPRSVPLELTLLFDCSGSIVNAGLLDPQAFDLGLLDEYEHVSVGVSGFSDFLRTLTPPTRDPARLRRALAGLLTIPPRSTQMYRAAIDTALRASSSGTEAVRMIVIVSDGEPSLNDAALGEDAVRVAKDRGIALCPVLLQRPMTLAPAYGARSGTMPTGGRENADASDGRRFWELNRAADHGVFKRLAKATGGEAPEMAMVPDFLSNIMRRMAERVKYEYVAGFYPAPADGAKKRREVEVVLQSKKRGELIGGVRSIFR